MAGLVDLPPRFNFRPVVTGRLYRGAEPVLLGDAWVSLVKATGFTTVIDLRMTSERAERGLPASVEGVENRSMPLFETALPSWVDPHDQGPSATALRYLEMLETGVSQVVSIVRYLATAPRGVTLIHCAAGRDRTGLVVAMILGLCGVDETQIVADYALSQEVVGDGRDAHPQTMRELLGKVRSRYGSVEALLTRAGLGPEEAAAARSFLGLFKERAGLGAKVRHTPSR